MHTREELWTALDGGFKAFMDGLGQLTEEELTASNVVGVWSVKDVVAHVWIWVDEAVHTVKAWRGARPWQNGVVYDDAWNEATVAHKAALPLISVVDGITGAHRQFRHQLDMLDDEALAAVGRASWDEEMPLSEFLFSMAEHYQEHAEGLKEYQKRCLDCD